MRSLLLAPVVAAVCVLAACGGDPAADATRAVDAFVAGLKSGDADAMAAVSLPADAELVAELTRGDARDMAFTPGKVTLDGDAGTIDVAISPPTGQEYDGPPSVTIHVKRVDGVWKVDATQTFAPLMGNRGPDRSDTPAPPAGRSDAGTSVAGNTDDSPGGAQPMPGSPDPPVNAPSAAPIEEPGND